MKVLTTALIKRAEEEAVLSGGFSVEELMKTAGEAAGEIINKAFPVKGKKAAVVSGNGNNGGDGFVCAAYLSALGADVTVVIPFGEPRTDNARHYFERLNGIPVHGELSGEFDIVIDALFGIGLNRPLDEKAMAVLEKINSYNCFKAAIDIPSGISANTGVVLGDCVKADLTVTFIALKPCFLLPEGSQYCGEVIVADIGVKPSEYDYLTVPEPVFQKRAKNSHKGIFGTALMLAGSYGMAGAAILAARGAVRSGVGILKAVICDKIYYPFTSSIPEAVCVPVKTSEQGGIDSSDGAVYDALSSCNAVLVGCGMGNNIHTRKILRRIISKSEAPIVIDADGINALCVGIDIIRRAKASVIITPHPGEMARLCGVSSAEIQRDRIGFARSFATDNNCIVVLKGANTVIASEKGEIFFNTTGNPGMATAGSGDVLAGILVSLLAQGIEPIEAAKAAVYLHGKAGDAAAVKRGEISLIASDIAENL